ncbi:ion channel [Halovulum sp. GXIMD14794]
MAIVIGLGLVAVMGLAHHFSLRVLERVSGYDRNQPNRTIQIVFLGLLGIHLLEILGWAAAYRLLLEHPAFDWLGGLSGSYSGSWSDLVYFSGIQFTTLGYTDIKAEGPIRLVALMQSLGGFMVLTWSATYIYSAWQRAFRLINRQEQADRDPWARRSGAAHRT